MKISVITTLFNYSHYICDCIDSVLMQDEPDSEIIIVDDASTDNPLDMIKPYLCNRVKYIPLKKNMGYSHAKNVGIKNSSAEVLVMLDADDMLTKNSLSMRYKKLMEGYDLVHGPALDLDKGKKKPSPMWKRWIKERKGPLAYKGIHAQTVMLKKDIHRRIGLYDETLPSKSDREMWGRVISNGFKIGYVDDYVCLYRLHPDQMHRSKKKKDINEKLMQEVCRKIEIRAHDLSDIEMLK